MKNAQFSKMAVAALAAVVLSVATVTSSGLSATTTVTVLDTNSPSAKIAPAKVDLPAPVAEVARMSQAGMGDELIIAYIQKSANSSAIDADQIVYLRDIGVSSPVIKALLDHAQVTGANVAATTAPPAPGAPPPAPGAEAQPQAGGTSSEPVTGPAASFYNALAPYGTWMNVPGYGWCWQPTVAASNSSWQPYDDNGNWLWSDNGWYWNSNYSWGWAPFHYGRWCQWGGSWLWCPDLTWGPAWVSWRTGVGFCGWAPLPPGACFTAGIGWSFWGVPCGFGFGFGIPFGCFTFCNFNHFLDHHHDGFFHHDGDFHHDGHGLFAHSTVNNNFSMDSHNHMMNKGVDPKQIEGATHSHLNQVSVRQMPQNGSLHGAQADRLTRTGNSMSVFRPNSNVSAVHNSSVLPHNNQQIASLNRQTFSSSHAFNGLQTQRNPSQWSSGTAGAFRTMPQGSTSRSFSTQPGMGGMRSAPSFNRNFSMGSAPQTFGRSAPSFSSRAFSSPSFSGRSMPSFGRSAPSFGGGGSFGAPHFGGGGGGGFHMGGGGGGGFHMGGGGGMSHGGGGGRGR